MTDQYQPPPFKPPPRSSRPSRPTWLVPTGFGVLLLVIVVLILLLVTRDDGSGDSTDTTPTVVPTSEVAPTTAATVVPPTEAPTSSDSVPTDSVDTTDGAACPEYTATDSLPLRLCNNGDLVADAQQGLVSWGAQIDADGLFGPATEAAVRDFQTENDLAVDGIIGPNTWEVLCPFTNNLCEPDG